MWLYSVAVNVSLRSRMFFLCTCWGGNYFLEITVSSFVYLRCNWSLEVCKSVTHDAVTTNCMEKREIVDKSSHISPRCYSLNLFISCNRTSGFLLTLSVHLIPTDSICYQRCSNCYFPQNVTLDTSRYWPCALRRSYRSDQIDVLPLLPVWHRTGSAGDD